MTIFDTLIYDRIMDIEVRFLDYIDLDCRMVANPSWGGHNMYAASPSDLIPRGPEPPTFGRVISALFFR